MSVGFNSWFKSRLVRRIFLIATLAAAAFLFISSFDSSGITFIIGIVLAMIAVSASIIDTIMNATEFSKTIKHIEKSNQIREAQYYGQPISKTCFSPQDRKEIKKKRLTFTGVILIKVVFIIILIALIVQNGVSL